jgi:hypothetical protein
VEATIRAHDASAPGDVGDVAAIPTSQRAAVAAVDAWRI